MKRMLLFVSISFIAACSSSASKDVLSVDKMQVVMTDMLLAEGFTENFLVNDSSKTRDEWFSQEYSKVMAIHNISQDQFHKSLNFYKKRPDLLKVIIDTVYQRGQRMRDASYQTANSKKTAVE